MTIIGDNMIGFCMTQKKFDGVFVFYNRISEDAAWCQGGSLLVAILARELEVACNLYPTDFDPHKAVIGDGLCFAGENIAPPGSKSFIPRVDRVALSYFKERW